MGTGENNNQRSVSYGDGVYKSEDGGLSFRNVGLKLTEHIARIVVDPRDSNVVYVAAPGPLWKGGGERGLYKPRNGSCQPVPGMNCGCLSVLPLRKTQKTWLKMRSHF